MIRMVFITAMAGFMFSSCDVRRNDKIAGIGNATATTVAMPDPTTVQMLDSVYDFKKVTEGEIVEYSFRFKNTGTKPLVISNVSATCGCTIPEKPEEPVQPGEMGFIKVKFNSQGRPGATHKTVNVLSNAAPEFPELLLQGEVIKKEQ